MAHQDVETPVGDAKFLAETNATSHDPERQVAGLGDQEDYPVERVEAVYRKLDLRIIPAFWVLYFLCSAIRSNIGLAQTMNKSAGHDLMSVLHLTAKDTSTALTLFYVAYVLFDCPSNLVMSRLSPRVWMARIVFAVGVIGTCFTAVKAAWSVKLLRFLLGVVIAATPEALKGEDAIVHYHDLKRVYHPRPWTLKDLGYVLIDWRLWPLTLMYFGVVGVGIGTQLYGNVIIASINSSFTGIQISLLFAPIWLMDFAAILLVTPISDRFHHYRPFFFSAAVCIQIAGLLTVTFALSNPWARYGGLLMIGFGLGPTVPICMTWTNEIFQRRHGEVGVAAASALVSGLGNLGSVTTTYALYTGWPEDSAPGPHKYRKSNLVMIGILCISILSSFVMTVLLKFFGNKPSHKIISSGSSAVDSVDDFQDGAARRELQQRGFGRMWWNRK
ncbi:putative vitamin h transporter 1 biotin symporter vht1 protein [Phaeoacremonium minimum UCRPA7]|uniref:Putative vitamin h transporter 1 biotin symporter vht1 protein n=1 Tax=Phaeoacremonium minimum (strain UCR-PA7) TaxID=1286976 RepID=R8BU47_PHAM7|nr:putative vitamin h transporter 1 biotin symporter vht1 protein [Phaeoacremonium minimum UCRPA7]EOO02898.1 putative vitamin h transporter 1 biotin symporter vht1 protein [Phaeoacremonium minimum UCRPA7]